MGSNRRSFIMQLAAGAAAIIASKEPQLKRFERSSRGIAAKAEREKKFDEALKGELPPPTKLYLVDVEGNRLAELSARKPATNGMLRLSGVTDRAGIVHGMTDENGVLLATIDARGGRAEKGIDVSTTIALL